MSRRLRIIIAVVGILFVLGGLGYAAQSLDVVGMIVSAHAPPRH